MSRTDRGDCGRRQKEIPRTPREGAVREVRRTDDESRSKGRLPRSYVPHITILFGCLALCSSTSLRWAGYNFFIFFFLRIIFFFFFYLGFYSSFQTFSRLIFFLYFIQKKKKTEKKGTPGFGLWTTKNRKKNNTTGKSGNKKNANGYENATRKTDRG